MIGFVLLSIAQVALPPVLVGQQPGNQKFSGGPFDGLSMGDVVTPKGSRFRGLVASTPNASPLSAENQMAVAAYIRGHKLPSSPSLKKYLAESATLTMCMERDAPCETMKLIPLEFAEPVKANTPYALSANTVRVEWLYGTALYYLTTLSLVDGKITAVENRPAWAPIVYNPASPAKAETTNG